SSIVLRFSIPASLGHNDPGTLYTASGFLDLADSDPFLDAKLNFVEEPVEILEREFKKLKQSRIAIIKVWWNSKRRPEFTWEREDQTRLKYPHLFSSVND
ncbi:hypothetical protein Tco_0237150, partial [Tanacetum coccineum]